MLDAPDTFCVLQTTGAMAIMVQMSIPRRRFLRVGFTSHAHAASSLEKPNESDKQ